VYACNSEEANISQRITKPRSLEKVESDLKSTKKSEHREVLIEEDVEDKVKRLSTELERQFIVEQELEHRPQTHITEQQTEKISTVAFDITLHSL